MESWDCIIIGAGPAGLTAAIYMARYRRRTLVVHDGGSRTLRIPLTRNVPGYEEGVVGADLIERLSAHATRYGATIEIGHVATAAQAGDGFLIMTDDDVRHEGRSLILATGIELKQIDLPDPIHEAAIRAGVLRYCPICDGYDHIDERIAVVGCDNHGAAEALFLRRFSPDITLFPQHCVELEADERRQLAEAGVKIVGSPVSGYQARDDEMRISVEGETDPLIFDVVYPALGVTPRNRLARMLGVEVNECGCTAPDSMVQTNVPGVYCAGDLLDGLDQISVAMGHGATAATRAHNGLRERDGEVLSEAA